MLPSVALCCIIYTADASLCSVKTRELAEALWVQRPRQPITAAIPACLRAAYCHKLAWYFTTSHLWWRMRERRRRRRGLLMMRNVNAEVKHICAVSEVSSRKQGAMTYHGGYELSVARMYCTPPLQWFKCSVASLLLIYIWWHGFLSLTTKKSPLTSSWGMLLTVLSV